jgi:hypothetical protein
MIGVAMLFKSCCQLCFPHSRRTLALNVQSVPNPDRKACIVDTAHAQDDSLTFKVPTLEQILDAFVLSHASQIVEF